LTRQLRHFGLRIVISTQGKLFPTMPVLLLTTFTEPTTVPAVLLDLCGVAIFHRFSSPAWWEHVAKHFSANFGSGSRSALDQIVTLEVHLMFITLEEVLIDFTEW
jgi:hypothetical protein